MHSILKGTFSSFGSALGETPLGLPFGVLTPAVPNIAFASTVFQGAINDAAAFFGVTDPNLRAARPVDLRVTMPARITDGDSLTAVVQLRNLLREEAKLDTPQSYVNLFPRVEFLSPPADACLVRRASTPNVITAPARRFLPGESATTSLDLTGEFPVGLRPGRYRLTVTYSGSLRASSTPVEFEVVAPADTTAYNRFRDVCSALVLNRPESPEAVLALAKQQSRFPYRAGLLNVARLRARGEVRAAIDRLLIEQHRSESGTEAEEDLKRIERWKKEDAARAQFEETFAAQLADPANAGVARDLRRLGSIARGDQFDDYEQFLSAHGGSFFASSVLQLMIDAVGDGILPRGTVKTDGDRLARDLYDRLLRGYPQSFHARAARQNPTAQRLLALPAEQ